MATAVEPSSQARTPTTQTGLALAGLAGGVYVLASLAVAFAAVPTLIAQSLPDTLATGFLSWTARFAAVVALVWLGQKLAGPTPPKGLRGGITIAVSALIAIFFIARAFGLNTEGLGTAGVVVTALVAGGLLFATFRLLASPRGEGWMVAVEDSGLASTTSYKRALGLRLRRLTILGVLLVGGTGAYALFESLGSDPWRVTIPFTQPAEGEHLALTVSNPRWVIPSVLFVLTLWVAWRAVNVPPFAEFLIATEAEMNKVSWTTRRRLFQDTMVVLVTTVLLTLFLLAVDLFWGWLLSREIVGVLPGKPTDTGRQAAQEARW